MASRLGRQLWNIYEDLRTNNRVGFLTDEDFQKYFLGFIAYKYLSENLELYLDRELEIDNLSFEEAYNYERYKNFLERESIYNLGYFLTPNRLFRNIVSSNNYGNIILKELELAFAEISNSSIGTESQEDFENLFESVNLQASQLGKTLEEKNRVVFNILEALSNVDFGLNEFNSSLSLKYPFQSYDSSSNLIGLEENLSEDDLLLNSKKNIFLEKDSILEEYALEANFNKISLDDLEESSKSLDIEFKKSDNTSSNNESFKGEKDSNTPLNQSYNEIRIENQYSIGDAFEYLLDKFSLNNSGSEDFYTPKDVSLLVSKLVKSTKNSLNAVYDPCCGSASLLLELNKSVPAKLICGQELNAYYYNLSRENMILHNIHFKDFDIKQGDSLENPQHRDYPKFDAVVSQIPFNVKWTAKKTFLDDERFNEYNVLAPRVKAEYAFIQHMLYHLKSDGIMIVVVPHGVLFRSASEAAIRKIILGKMNYLDAVIGLPSNMFYATNSPACILIFRKNRQYDEDVLFIDASREFEKVKLRNNLRKEDIDKIVNTYKNRKEVDRYSHNASLKEIVDNDFNLNIPRYVDTYEKDSVNIEDIYKRREEVSKELQEVTEEIDALCRELNIENPLMDNY